MSIQEKYADFKQGGGLTELLLAILIVMVGVTGFLLGRHSVGPENGDMPSIVLKEPESPSDTEIPSFAPQKNTEQPAAAITASEGQYVGSRSGTKYHLPWCPGAQQIKEENKVWFATKDEAESKGYTPAANCKGI